MARSISVYRPEDFEPCPPNGWRVRDDAVALFDEPLGGEAFVRESWSEPAATLRLPLLAAIYEHGFYHGIRWGGSELRQVLAELTRLEAHWLSSAFAAEVAADLAERSGHLRSAVAAAEKCGGFVVIV